MPAKSTSTASEQTEQAKILKWLRGQPRCRAVKIVAGPHSSEIGIADLLLCLNGRFIAIELKRPGRFSKICPPVEFEPHDAREHAQKRFLLEIIDAGGVAFLADNAEACIAALSMIISG